MVYLDSLSAYELSASERHEFLVEYGIEKEPHVDEMHRQLNEAGFWEYERSDEFVRALVTSYEAAYVKLAKFVVMPEALSEALLPAALSLVSQFEPHSDPLSDSEDTPSRYEACSNPYLQDAILSLYFERVIEVFWLNRCDGHSGLIEIRVEDNGVNDSL
jgi:hypothetical protein